MSKKPDGVRGRVRRSPPQTPANPDYHFPTHLASTFKREGDVRDLFLSYFIRQCLLINVLTIIILM